LIIAGSFIPITGEKFAFASRASSNLGSATPQPLEITAIGPTNMKLKGTVTLVKEGGAWKWDGEEVM
jgi:hypothetical protein